MNQKAREQVTTALRACGEDLCKGELHDKLRNKGRLRILQGEMRPALGLREDALLRAVAFIVFVWIDRYYFNLSGTFPSQISEDVAKIRRRMLVEKTGPALKDLADALGKSAAEAILTSLADVLGAYLDSLADVEKIAEESGR